MRESLSRKRSGLRSYLLCNWKIILFYRTIMPLVPFSTKNVKVTHFGFADPILVGGGGTRSVVVSTAGPGNVYYLPPPSKHTLTLVMFNCSLWSSHDDPLWALSTTDIVLKSEVLRTPWLPSSCIRNKNKNTLFWNFESRMVYESHACHEQSWQRQFVRELFAFTSPPWQMHYRTLDAFASHYRVVTNALYDCIMLLL